jgi:aspartate/methionine/tyrosine aminotransferase
MQSVQRPVIADVAALIRANPGTISLGQGVVHYGPPASSFEAVAKFGYSVSEHHYQAAAGLPPLQEALRTKLLSENRILLGDDRVLMVTAGSNMAFYHALLASCDPGDEVVIMAPFYFNHEMAICMASCRPVLAATDASYQLQLEVIESVLTDRTRAVVTISPNNPAGVVYRAEDLRAVNELCRRRGLYHISDEAYEYFTYGDSEHFSPGSLDDSSDHTISLFSFSKAYGLASWRVGYMVAPRELLSALEKSQDTILICPPVISQLAALGALEAGRQYCIPFVEEMARVRQMCLDRLGALSPGCIVPRADGAFYLLARLDTERGSMEVVERLVTEFGVAVIPGSGFGLTDSCHLRIAYGALEPHTVEAGMDRLVRGLTQIMKG